jgi:hypothetical protein
MNAQEGARIVHQDGNPLNNQCSNLRNFTQSYNLANAKAKSNKSESIYKDVRKAGKIYGMLVLR